MSGRGNFAFLETHDAQLARLGALAERVFADDANTCLLKLRQYAEHLAGLAAARAGVWTNGQDTQIDRLRRLRDRGVLTGEVSDLFHHIRKLGNRAAHDLSGEYRDALTALKYARSLGVWYVRTRTGNRGFSPGPFVPPPDPAAESAALKAELERLRAELESSLSASQKAEAAARAAAEARLTAEDRARRAEAERAEWEVLAQAVEADRTTAEQALATLQAQAEAAPVAVAQDFVQQAQEAGEDLDLDEQATRRLIDEQLRLAGWEADSETLTHAAGVRPQKGKALAIAEWPTANGPADYLLFVDETPIAVVEAKRRNRNVSQVIDQAQRYADGLDADIPFLFATNGRPFLRQFAEGSGIWFRDARRPDNLRRSLEDWYTPGGLTDLLRQDIDGAQDRLAAEPFAYNFGLRDYQERAIRAVEDAVSAGQRDILIAMATGTGKTKTCIALIYRLLKARRFRRILFLVDRSALGEQAGQAFENTRMEGQQPFSDIYDVRTLGEQAVDAETRVHIATVQALVKRTLYAADGEASPPVDQYDCIVVDECHRGYLLDREMGDAELRFRDQRDYISKYRRVLDRFDAVRIGLTATPALHTVDIFGPPVFRYTYPEAVIDGWLVDHEPPLRLHTKLSEEGIQWNKDDDVEVLDARTGVIDLIQAPDALSFEVESFNRKVITRPFNAEVCAWLAGHIDPSLPGKTLIFCATDAHADTVVEELKHAFAARYGRVEDAAVQKITGQADRPLEKIRHFKNEAHPKVAVTVDLLTTGIDVPEIVNLVFVRRVNSRILYEQMIGRATRLCEPLSKTAFRIFDAVGLYEAMQQVTEMKPVAANPNITFTKLADDLFELMGLKVAEPDEETDEHAPSGLAEDGPTFQPGPPSTQEAARRGEGGRYLVDQVIAKLQRKKRRLSPKMREQVAHICGQDLEGFIRTLREAPPEVAAKALFDHRHLLDLLDRGGSGEPLVLPISHHPDAYVKETVGYGEGIQRPEDYLEKFQAFIQENVNALPALAVVAQRPRDLTREQLREVQLLLAEKHFDEADLRAAWRDARNEDIAASIIGYIRQAAIGDALEPYDARVDRALAHLLSKHRWAQPQREWLQRIAKQIKKNTIVDRQALDAPPFDKDGGFTRLNKVFDGRLEDILAEINEGIWERAG